MSCNPIFFAKDEDTCQNILRFRDRGSTGVSALGPSRNIEQSYKPNGTILSLQFLTFFSAEVIWIRSIKK